MTLTVCGNSLPEVRIVDLMIALLHHQHSLPGEDINEALHIAIGRGKLRIVNQLIEAGADLHTEIKPGAGMVSFCCSMHRNTVFRRLLGAATKTRNTAGA